MQLLIVLALLMCCGSGGKNLLSEVKPVLESFGGDEIKDALKSAEEISSVLSAVRDLTSAASPASGSTEHGGSGSTCENSRTDGRGAINFPLAPVNDIADRDIAYSLSKYIEG